MELLGKGSHTSEKSNSRFASLSLHAYGGRDQSPLSAISERDRLVRCWATFRLQCKRFLGATPAGTTPLVEDVQMPVFLSSIDQQEGVVEWLMNEWELLLYPESCVLLRRELLSFLPAMAMDACKRGCGWLEIVATVEEVVAIV